MAIPPSSAKAIASLIWRRSKYFSRIATDRTISAELARPLRVLRPQAKVLLADPRRGGEHVGFDGGVVGGDLMLLDRKSTRLNSSHANISYAVFCLKKKKKQI